MQYNIRENEIYYDDTFIVESPAFLSDKKTGTLHKIGDLATVQEAFDELCQADKTGVIAKDMFLFEFDKILLPLAVICDEMNNLNGTADYAKVFFAKYLSCVE